MRDCHGGKTWALCSGGTDTDESQESWVMEPYHVIPLCNAVLYTIGALCLKRATNDGVGPWRTTFFSNLVLFLVAFPFWFFGDPIQGWGDVLIAFSIGTAFFLGQLFGCLAIHKGDVSLLTPLMGTKTVFVAVMVTIAFGEDLTLSVWIGAVLSAVAVVLMRGSSVTERKRLLPSLCLGLLCSFFYATNDTITQRFGRELGFATLMGSAYSVVMLWSFLLVPFFKSPMRAVSGKAWTWMGMGALLMATQASGMAYVLSTYGKATVVNILYSSRGIWSVFLVWVVGHWFSNQERDLGGSVLARRLIGSLLLIVAIFAALG